MVLAGLASAEPTWDYYEPTGSPNSPKATPQEACNYALDAEPYYDRYRPISNHSYFWRGSYPDDNVYTCTFTKSNGSNLSGLAAYGRNCPDGEVFNGSQCTPDEPCPEAGTDGPTLIWREGYKTGPNPFSPDANGDNSYYISINWTADYNGCEVKDKDGEDNNWCEYAQSPSENGYYKYACYKNTQYTGEKSSGSQGGEGSGEGSGETPPSYEDGENSSPDVEAPEPSTPNNDVGGCPSGTTQTGVGADGSMICTNNGTADKMQTKTESENTTNNADGSTTSTKVTTFTNPDGSTTTTTTTTTTAADGTKTTNIDTTTGQASDGTDGQHEGDDSEGSDFCDENPNLSACLESSVQGYSCDNFQCEGDAIQCLIAKTAWQQNCALTSENEYTGDGQNAIDGVVADGTPNAENPEVVEIPTALDMGGFGINRECFEDKDVQVLGQTMTIPFAQVCPYLQPIRYVSIIIGLLVGMSILTGAVSRS